MEPAIIVMLAIEEGPVLEALDQGGDVEVPTGASFASFLHGTER